MKEPYDKPIAPLDSLHVPPLAVDTPDLDD